MSNNEKNNNIKNIHAVHSAKGGSGKSSFSFALANLLCDEQKILFDSDYELKKFEPFDEKSKNVLLFDADFKGTSFKSIFSKDVIKKHNAIYIEDVEKNTFDQLIFDKIFDLDNYIIKCIVQNIKEKNELSYKLINICFSSEKYSSKKRFYYSRNHDNSEQLSVERFRDWFINLLNNISAVYDNKDEFNDLIFDLSPSSDEYTETMLDTFRIVSSGKSPEYNFYHYVVVTDDSAHINATVEYICDLMSGSMRQEDNRRVVIVLNQTYNDELYKEVNDKKNSSEGIDVVSQDVIKKIKMKLANNLDEQTIKKIKFLYLPFNKEFFTYSRKSTIFTSKNEKDNNSVNFAFPIKYLVDDRNVGNKKLDTINKSDKLIKIIEGKGEHDG